MLDSLMKRSDLLLALGVVCILVVLVIPMPVWLMDFALAFNITFSLIILLSTLYVRKALDLSIFPGMLLLITLMRLALNVATTRLILSEAYAGDVINSFGQFVVGGNYVVGFIVFAILVIIQFVVITKGAGRISEVAARFTLDAMPGKQMAIDADLNAGLITDTEARSRRAKIAEEADFYGAMDGASKFVRGDAIAGILITLINIVGGFIIGVAMNDMSMTEALRTYTLLSVGDGLVTQIPALIVSVAAGLIVTRADSDGNMGSDLVRQLTGQPSAILVAGGMLIVFGIVPGMPTLTFFALGSVVGAIGYMARQDQEKKALAEAAASEEVTKAPEEKTEDLLKVDPLEIEIGAGLIPMVDSAQGGDLLQRVSTVRRELAIELGIIIPPVRIRDNVELDPNVYRVKLNGVKVGLFELMNDHLLAINPGAIDESIEGFSTIEPAFGLKATWTIPNLKETAEARGYTVVEPSAVLATHLTEIIRTNAAELLTRQDVAGLIDTLKEDAPALVEESVPTVVTIALFHRVLQSLLRERIPIRDLGLILETVSDYASATKEPEVLAEYARMTLKRRITELYRSPDSSINVFTVDPAVEQAIAESIQNSRQGLIMALAPEVMERLIKSVNEEAQKLTNSGFTPICLCSPNVRLALRKVIETSNPQVVVLSFNELVSDVEVIAKGIVRLTDDN
ncbi:MAG: flagellar biosynthesis protein FlhA [candidate division Zixibacteria bacterium]|nr:flagellar biosynthesis protein FlhA [candidate division Zixibacteria bacterium]